MRESIKAAIMALARANDGRLTADLIVNEARSETSPLHSEFEWNDTEAAEKYRVSQARTLIRKVTLKVTHNYYSMSAPVFVRDPGAEFREQGYISIARAADDENMRHEILVAEFARANAALNRAKAVGISLGIADQLQGLIDGLSGLRRRIEDPDPEGPSPQPN